MLEIACFTTASATTALSAGADRIELCTSYAAGGLTPSLSSLTSIRQTTTTPTVPINVMIRPRPGDFVYSAQEFAQMKSDLQTLKPHASGFVFGILDARGAVDEARNRELAELARPLPCTFHRAFDGVGDQGEAVGRLIRCGFAAILTSGGEGDAVAGAGSVARLQEEFGERISFIVGGGVRSTNVAALRRQTKAPWYHSAALTQPGEVVDGEEVGRMQSILRSEQ